MVSSLCLSYDEAAVSALQPLVAETSLSSERLHIRTFEKVDEREFDVSRKWRRLTL
jgi:hypothetical protein